MKNRRPWLKQLSYRLIERRIIEHAAVVHFTSEQERVEAGKLQEVSKTAILPIASPRHSDVFLGGQFRARYPASAKRRLILFLSRLDRKKGLDLLLHAFAKVRREVPDALLVLAGSGSEKFVDGLKHAASSLGIERDIVWTGFLTDNEKQAAFADADLFVLPSYSENFGIAVVEAMVAGLPVVVSDQVAINREIAASHAGLVVSCDVNQLAAALVRLLDDPALRQSMGDHGKTLARQHYAPGVAIHKLITMYDDIALRTAVRA
jgi:glycosyltransferase involved in cell wall biosynthesis